VVLDLFGSYKFSEDTLLNFSVENVTDQYYYGPLATTGMPSPGRTARVGLTHRLGGNGFPDIADIFSLDRPSIEAARDDWTGLYAGAHYGHVATDVSGTVTTLAGGTTRETASFSDNGGFGGAQIGYNYQFANQMVIGVETDFSLLDHKGKSSTLATESAALISGRHLESETEYNLDWSATLRGRLGYSFGSLMVYGTGGVGLLQRSGMRTQYASNTLSSSTANPNPQPTSTTPYILESDSAVNLGWTAGAGFEWAMAKHWSIKGEYSFADFGEADMQFDQARSGVTRSYRTCSGCTPSRVTIPGSLDTINGRKSAGEADMHMVKFGINYRF
jgi:hemoglobin/transferrin/lactoferrin receptor protein